MNKKVFLRVFLITLLVLVLIGCLLYFGMMRPAFAKMNDHEDAQALSAILDQPGGEGFNMLLLGTDGSNKRTDTIMLVSVHKNGEIALSSIPRDTRVKIGKKHQKINAALPIGGREMLIEAVREVTGAPIHYYAQVNFEGFKNIVDILGGVEFEVPQDMFYEDPAQDLYIDLKAGLQLLDGDKAEQLCRFRKYPEADIARTRVQQAFVKAMIEQKMTFGNLLKAPAVLSEIADHCETNFSQGDLMRYLGAILSAKSENIVSYPMPGGGKTIGGVSYFVQDSEEAYALYSEHFFGTGAPAEKVYTNVSK